MTSILNLCSSTALFQIDSSHGLLDGRDSRYLVEGDRRKRRELSGGWWGSLEVEGEGVEGLSDDERDATRPFDDGIDRSR